MEDVTRKISRGQVWFLVDKDIPAVHYTGSVQGKNRPWLIVSNNRCNQSSPIYTVVPLTTAVKTPLPVHVEFNDGMRNQTILCEQLRTIPKTVFNDPGSYYKYVLSENVMKQVDEAMAVQLGISLTFPNSEYFWESLEKLVRVKVKQAVEDSKVEAIDVKRVVSNIDNIINETLAKQPDAKDVPQRETVVDKPENTTVNVVAKTPVKTRRKWTENDMKTFLSDCEKMQIKDVSAKYGMTMATIYATKYNFKKRLNHG